MTPEEREEFIKMNEKLTRLDPILEDKKFRKRFNKLQDKLSPEQNLLISMSSLLNECVNLFGAENTIKAFSDTAKNLRF